MKGLIAMTGTAKKLIDKLYAEKAKGDKVLENSMGVKLILKGIPVNKITATTPDDPAMISKIKAVLQEYGVRA